MPGFLQFPQRRAFLDYIIKETLAGRASHLKGVAIATSVFGRDESFDQQTDPVVRLEARRLRHGLNGYYSGPGLNDPIRISVPRDSYVPQLDQNPYAADYGSKQIEAGGSSRSRSFMPSLFAIDLSVAVVTIWMLFSPSTILSQKDAIQSFPTGPVLAVLPFEMLGDSPQYIAQGLTQQLTAELVRFHDLWVLPAGIICRDFSTAV